MKSDNGEEYDSQELKDFCSKHGIKMIKIILGTPEQNGVAERMNRTLNERARCMQIQSGLPKAFWAEAINTIAYLIVEFLINPCGNCNKLYISSCITRVI